MSYLIDSDNWAWLFEGRNARFILEGFLVNLEIAIISIILALIAGLALALLRLSKNRAISFAAGAWVDVFRNLPLIFLLLYLSLSIPNSWRDAWEGNVPGWAPEAFESGRVLAAFLGLVLYNSAVLAEIMRAGILSLSRGQGEAAAALGLSYQQSMRLVILPQGLRRMVPATVSQLITLNKDTTLISIIAITEGLRAGRIVSNTAGNPFTGTGGSDAPILQVLIFIGVLFIIVNYLLSILSKRLELRERARTGTKLQRVRGLEDQVAADPI